MSKDIKKDRQKYVIDYVKQLERHYAFHGKNVVFWSCKSCKREKSQ